ncbi:DUF3291 domain-containing protein [Crenobacter cavernae]|uniref:DUF3291 domain-containing protein n=1 Tax=Crenobacter cavernae TaxID=2290923 RepID=A0A345Y2K2_9NEIS|nr:DUF3291 domain-containing protein [Crenobacter cavernae]AXK38154.1 DUF3291 domain-containing protein [Crenobacter cavernae]
MEDRFQLAQVNIARAKAPLDHPIMKGFVDRLDHINALAEQSPGFVWRLQTEVGDATAIKAFEDQLIIVNLSVWDSFESLKSYVYTGEHVTLIKNKKSWFDPLNAPSLALWWISEGHIPTVESAKARLEALQEKGSTPEAFTFAKPYPAPNQDTAPRVRLA